MKTKRLFNLGLIVFSAILFAQNPVIAQAKVDATTEISVLHLSFQAAMEKIGADFVNLSSRLETWYLTNLDKLQTETAKRGYLDGAVAIKAEHDRIAAHTDTTVDQVRAMALPLRNLRGTYEVALKKSMDEGARREGEARRNHLTSLDALQKRITITGDIEQALLVKAEKEKFAAEKVGLAPPSPSPVVSTESTKPELSPKTTASTIAGRTVIQSYRDILLAIPSKLETIKAKQWTSAQRDAVNAELKKSLTERGCKARMRLKIEEIADWNHGTKMTLYSDIPNQEGYLIRVFAHFSNDWKKNLLTIKKGDTVLINGDLDSVRYWDLWGAFTLHIIFEKCSFAK